MPSWFGGVARRSAIHHPLSGLPLAFGTGLEAIPRPVCRICCLRRRARRAPGGITG